MEEQKQVDIQKISDLELIEEFVGMFIRCGKNESPRDVLREALSSRGVKFGINTIDLVINNPCGGSALYEKIDDVPEVDVPCSCGNPNH